MSQLLGCPQGHQWEAGGDATDPCSPCPTCGAPGRALEALPPSASAPQEVQGTAPTLGPPTAAFVPATLAWPPQGPLPECEAPILPFIPGYEILGVLGHGGMGVVYKARQNSLQRLVALKMVLAGAYTNPRERARLHLEAEALADLQHPHIVQVYEVGEHDHCPYLALEFIDGGNLAEQLAHTPQPADRAAALVETLAGAMHCAHQRGIVHRDLKPANVLLTADGTPKITDFGLAKRLEAQGQTQTGAILGTPNYMAPEQAAGMSRDVGPLADVYALGAILYETITGQPPFHADTALKTIAQVVSADPVAPRRLRQKVPRDLETICLKCLQKVPQLRYASAQELAEDLRRFRSGEPIQARPVSAAERTWKWVKRRPALAALLLLTVLGGLGLIAEGLWHNASLRAERDRAEANYQRAEKNFERARQAVEQMLTEVAQEQLAYEPRMELKRRALLEKALSFYQDFLQEKSNDPGLRQATALAYQRVGDITHLLRQEQRAEDAYGQAIALLGPLTEEYPAQQALRQNLADSHNFRGEVLRLTEREALARQDYDAALGIQRQLVEDFPNEPAYRRDQARTLYNLGLLSRSANQPQEAKEHFAAAITLLEDLAAQYPDNPEYRQHLARGYLNRGPVLRLTDGFAAAQASYDRAATLLQKLHQKHPNMPEYQHELGITRNNLGILLAGAGRWSEAAAAHQSALTLFDQLVTNFPSVPDYRKELANTHNNLGIVRTREHNVSAAKHHFDEARQRFGQLVREFADVPDYQVHLAMTLGNLAWLHTEQKDWHRARPLIEEAIGGLKAVLRMHPQNYFGQQALRTQYQSLAETLVQLKDHAGAAVAATALPTVLRERAQDYYYAACFLARCVPLAQEDDRLGDAAERQAATDRYADWAVAMLREALRRDDKGWQRLPNEAEVFRPLQGRDGFSQLRAELQARTARATRGPVP